MAKISEDIIRAIIDRADIVEVVGDFLKLRKTGVRYTALCPFHDDKTDGNFIVYPRGNCYKCFTCDAKGGVVDFLMHYAKMSYPDAIRWLGKKYCIEVDDVPLDWTPPPPRPTPPPLPVLILPWSMVNSREQLGQDTLCRWLRRLPWDNCQLTRLLHVLMEYHVGHARQGHTIFWQIDEEGRVRTGKMMLYRDDGHRDKQSRHNFDWIHSMLFRDRRLPQYDEDKMECKPCIFGLHLLSKYPDADVRIVESEKTAIIMATAYGNSSSQVWMACGGAENLNRDKLAPIVKQHRHITLYPDRDAIDKWRAKAANLHYDRVSVDTQAVTEWWREEDGEKADIADVVIRMLTAHKNIKPSTIGDLIKTNTAIGQLVEKLNLTEDNGTEE